MRLSLISLSRPDGTLIPLDRPYNPNLASQGQSRAPARTPNPYAQSSGRTPGWGGGRTPNPYASGDGKTPAWNAGSRTPNPYAADGGKTPAWNAASRTPNPYADGGKTPAWSASSRTPNPYSSNDSGSAWNANDGSRTPRPSWGGGWASPARPAETESWVCTGRMAVFRHSSLLDIGCTYTSRRRNARFLLCADARLDRTYASPYRNCR